VALLAAPAVLALGCSDDIKNDYYYENYYGDGGSAEPGKAGSAGTASEGGGDPSGEGGEGGSLDGEGGNSGEGGSGGEAGDGSLVDPRYPDAPVMDTPVGDFELDIFDTVGNRYWFAVSDEQRLRMNGERHGAGNGDLYTPGGASRATYVDHLWVTTPSPEPRTADFGKVQVRVVGQSTGKDWDELNIPNFNVDADEFTKGQRIGGYEHLRFGNGQVSNIFRERLTLELYRRLGYPAPRATFVWVSSNVWGSEISIPYTLVERYKRAFCDRYSEEFGGGCKNMWEFFGRDFNDGGGWGGEAESVFDDPESCQIDECEGSRAKELEALLLETPFAEGFKAATAEYIDWPAFHRFQCLSYVFSTGDDVLHNLNNIVLVERADGKFQYLPYSIDISLGQEWYPYEPLTGDNVLAQGCQADSQCWADTFAECETVIEELTALQPRKLLKNVYNELSDHGMLRPGDEARYEFLDAWFEDKLAGLPADLERYRDPGSVTTCERGQVDCGGWCDYPENCEQCIPPGKEPLPDPGGGGMMGGFAGAAAAGGAPGVAGGIGVAGDFGMGGGGPIECPAIELYQTQ
jgi:hypothetical protein